jgi:alpha-tubulin suppressor-like RCC1 family protein
MKTKRNPVPLWLLCVVFSTLNLQPSTVFAQPVTNIAAGSSHSLFLKGDGSLWAMGYNKYGQLGDGTYGGLLFFATNRPEQIVASNVTAIAGGEIHSLFLKNDGSLWAMGDNSSGQLGDGTGNTRTNRPEQIVANDVTAIAAGGIHSLFLKSDGSLWAMGYNSSGQLGDGTTNNANLPEQIMAGNVTAIAAGGYHSLFLKSDGSLWAMGYNSSGQLGDGTYNQTNLPEQIVASNVTAIAAGFDHSLFLKSDGSLWVMGNNMFGQLGDGTGGNAKTNLPEQIVASGVTAIAGGGGSSLFLKNDGSLWAMGGAGFMPTNCPERVVNSGVTTIATGNAYSLFLKSDGSLWAIGYNKYGQLGDGTYVTTNRAEQILAAYNQIFGRLLGGRICNCHLWVLPKRIMRSTVLPAWYRPIGYRRLPIPPVRSGLSYLPTRRIQPPTISGASAPCRSPGSERGAGRLRPDLPAVDSPIRDRPRA